MSASTTHMLLRPFDGGDTRWQTQAECRRRRPDGSLFYDPEMWFAVGTSGPARLQNEEAKSVCSRCPVLASCREWALVVQEYGVAGGLDEDERRAERRRRAADRKAVSA